MAKKHKTRKGFTPFKAPVNPPPGTYDPSINAQVRATGRGLADLTQDYGVGKTRAEDDYLIGAGEITRGRDEALTDLTTGHDRSLSDLLTARTRGTEDYNTSVATLGRNYRDLGYAQGGTITQAGGGTFQGGALVQALQKRVANEALDRAPLDTNYNRYLADSRTQEERLNSDYALGTQRTSDTGGRQLDALSLQLDRAYGGQGDQTIGLARAGREATQLGIDATEARWAQARGTGYVPPEKPANEHTDPRTHQVFRLIRTPSGQLVRLLPSGRQVRRPRYSLRKR